MIKIKSPIVMVSTCFLLISLLYFVNCSDNDDNQKKEESQEEPIFQATHEWKIIKEGQAIPPGLHVRMNFQTGIKEAKLLGSHDDKEEKQNAVTAVAGSESEDESVDSDNTKSIKIIHTPKHHGAINIMEDDDGEQTVFASGKLTSQQIKEALKNLVFEDFQVAGDVDVARVKENFRSIGEIKNDLADLNLGVRTEAEEVTQLMNKFLENQANEADKLSALSDLQFITHHVDAARDFVQYGGIQKIIVPCLNSSSHEIQIASASLLGAASQGNPLVQLAAMRNGVMSLLLRFISNDSCKLMGDPTEKTKCKTAIHAISCLIRGFPAGQHQFIREGGVTVLAQGFDTGGMDIKIKIATLLHDLVMEGKQLARDSQWIEQYKAIDLESVLFQSGWCNRIVSILFSPYPDKKSMQDDLAAVSISELPIRQEHDIVEKVISAMLVLSTQCKEQFNSATPIVRHLIDSYSQLAVREEVNAKNDTFYSDLLHLVKSLLIKLQIKDEL